ncbi:MAG TPA: hypothetical protein VFM18_12315, partial [Methanosarcina sp.]|nr:hypothetical protein [Methanosarcina sp.]
VLDGFLALIDPKEQPIIYNLVTNLTKTIEEENFDDLVSKIMDPKVTLLARIKALFTKQGLEGAKNAAMQQIRELTNQKTNKIVNVLNNMEKDLQKEMDRLSKEIQKQEKLKDSYTQLFDNFALTVLYLHGCLEKSKEQFKQLQQTEPANSTRLENFRDKLQAFESRTLAVEGTLSRLPAEQIVIRQLQNSGITTIQETTNTANSRFSSIKLTLLNINSALVEQSVQKLGMAGANLDNNLLQVRSKLMKQVIQESSTAPGRNRLMQAEQLAKVVKDSKELLEIVENARQTNQQNFQQASKIFADSRNELLQLGNVVNPTASLNI